MADDDLHKYMKSFLHIALYLGKIVLTLIKIVKKML